jgi:enamine deaminase RidA (YjgF/YER057c/UK114 family)
MPVLPNHEERPNAGTSRHHSSRYAEHPSALWLFSGGQSRPAAVYRRDVGRDTELKVIEGKEAQFAQAFENVKKVLTAAGASFDQVVEMVTYHTDMHDLALFIEVKNRYFRNPDRLPTWTAITTPALAMPGLFVEIKCTACLE